jgi:hypothetical protein
MFLFQKSVETNSGHNPVSNSKDTISMIQNYFLGMVSLVVALLYSDNAIEVERGSAG